MLSWGTRGGRSGRLAPTSAGLRWVQALRDPPSWLFWELLYLERKEVLSHTTLEPSDPLWLRKQEVAGEENRSKKKEYFFPFILQRPSPTLLSSSCLRLGTRTPTSQPAPQSSRHTTPSSLPALISLSLAQGLAYSRCSTVVE